MAFVPFRNITNRGALLALGACGLLTLAYYRLDEAVEQKKAYKLAHGRVNEEGWPARR